MSPVIRGLRTPSISIALALCAPAIAFAQGEWKQLAPLPNPIGVAAPFAGVSNQRLIVAGGANFPGKKPWEGGKKVWHDTIWVLDAPDANWREAGKLPRPLAYGVSATVNGSLLCIGGSDSDRHYADVFALRWDVTLVVNRDTVPPPLPVPLANAAGAVDSDDVVYVACGSTEPGDRAPSARVFACGYRWKALEWRELPPLPAEPRILPIAAASGNAFFVFGGAAVELKDGKANRRYLRDAWRHTFSKGWERLADLPKPVAAAPSPTPVFGGKAHILGGDDGSLVDFKPLEKHPGFPKTNLAYDIARDKWDTAEQVAASRATVPCVNWRGLFVVPSGEVQPGIRSQDVWSFSPITP